MLIALVQAIAFRRHAGGIGLGLRELRLGDVNTVQRRYQVGLQAVDSRLIGRRVNRKKRLAFLDALSGSIGSALRELFI